MSEDKEKSLIDLKNKVAGAGFAFISAFCGFLYMLGFNAHDDLYWFILVFILTLKPVLILVVAYFGGNLINGFILLLIELKKL